MTRSQSWTTNATSFSTSQLNLQTLQIASRAHLSTSPLEKQKYQHLIKMHIKLKWKMFQTSMRKKISKTCSRWNNLKPSLYSMWAEAKPIKPLKSSFWTNQLKLQSNQKVNQFKDKNYSLKIRWWNCTLITLSGKGFHRRDRLRAPQIS